jgi:transcriptional regulator with XRE-family HTH domain
MDALSIGQAVKRYRKLHKLTMEELGALIQTNHSYISQLEAGKLMPGSDVLGKLADALRVSADALLNRDAGTDERLIRLMNAASGSAVEDVLRFYERMNTLPATEQRLFARLVRLSASEYAMKAPRNIKGAKAQPEASRNVARQARIERIEAAFAGSPIREKMVDVLIHAEPEQVDAYLEFVERFLEKLEPDDLSTFGRVEGAELQEVARARA